MWNQSVGNGRSFFGKSVVVALVMLASMAAAHANGLEWRTESCTTESGRVAILVGGIRETYESLNAWGDVYAAQGYCVVGFVYDYRADTLTQNAAELAAALVALGTAGAKDVVIVAHSMGGLVARAAVLKAGADGVWGYDSVNLVALGTPWGGFAVANPTQWLPFAAAIAKLIGMPMGIEIGNNAPFMAALTRDLPERVTLSVYEGGFDHIATPDTASGKQLYAANVAAATRRVLVPAADHMTLLDPQLVASAAI